MSFWKGLGEYGELARRMRQLHRGSERPYVSWCRPLQSKQSFGASEDGGSDEMPFPSDSNGSDFTYMLWKK
jgi:hypothetical protein